jgi:hypothetical protein
MVAELLLECLCSVAESLLEGVFETCRFSSRDDDQDR